MNVDGWAITRLQREPERWQGVKDGVTIVVATQAELYRLIARIEAEKRASEVRR